AKDPKRLKQKQESVCRIQDDGYISHDTYAKVVPISVIDIQTQAHVDSIEEPDITKTDTVKNVIQLIRKCGYRSIINILKFIMPKLIEKQILNFPNISIRIT
ncbi:24776_t:CDS:2, partial [Cetraspora pellucida]